MPYACALRVMLTDTHLARGMADVQVRLVTLQAKPPGVLWVRDSAPSSPSHMMKVAQPPQVAERETLEGGLDNLLRRRRPRRQVGFLWHGVLGWDPGEQKLGGNAPSLEKKKTPRATSMTSPLPSWAFLPMQQMQLYK